MSKRWLVALAGIVLSSFAMGCVADPETRPSLELIDGGAATAEGGSLQLPDGELVLPTAEAGAPPAGGKSCKEVDACQMACKDDACRQECLTLGSVTAKTQMGELEACVAKVSCSSANGSLAGWIACVGAACPGQFTACFDAEPGGSGKATCLQIISCTKACTSTDTLCLGQCVWRGTAAAQSAFFSWTKCSNTAQKNQCQALCQTPSSTDCSQCINYFCETQATGCKSN